MLLRGLCVALLLVTSAAIGQPLAPKEVFSRAALMAEGVIAAKVSRPRVEILAQQQGKSVAVMVSERVQELRQKNGVRAQVLNPDGEAKPGEYPWMVAFEVWDSVRGQWVQFCGGSIIAPRIVLSAVHCNNFPPEFIRVVVQATVLDNSSSIRYYHVSTVETHPQFNRVELKLSNGRTIKGLINDFALFVLTQDPGVRPVSLTAAPMKKDVFAFGAGRALGWGITPTGGAAPSLMFLDVPIVNDLDCGKAYSPLQNSMLCAGLARGGKDTCQGDSGGPLVVAKNAQHPERWTDSDKLKLEQAAVISFGEGCGVPGFFGIYSSIAEGRKWIEERLAAPR